LQQLQHAIEAVIANVGPEMLVDVFNNFVIYEPSAIRHFSRMSTFFEARATKERVLHLRERLLAWKFVQYFLKRTLCRFVVYPL
jgi:hypothetical protein